MTTVLAFDPSISCTGWALVRTEPMGARLLTSGAIIPEAGSSSDRLTNLMAACCNVDIGDIKPDAIAVEFWQTTSFGRKRDRNTNTLPLYGAAVGVVFMAAKALATKLSVPVHEVSVTDWGLRIPAGDADKSRRVEAVRAYLEADLRAKYTRAEAGNVADAALMAWWLCPRIEFEKARAA